MNFKRFHESKNLLPSDSVRYEYAIRYGNEVITFSGGAMYIVPIENGETYTVKIHTPNVSVSVIRLALYEQLAPSPDTTAYNTREILNTIEPTLTITNSKNKPYLIVQIAGAYVNDYGIDDVMLNTGSTALPYEPYSSEVWHDIPHYIMKTATDTITTLPAVIYADGNNATVGISGNTVQTGAPTPQNPIYPSECGERTGNLLESNPYKIGYSISNDGTEIQNSEFNIYTAKVSAGTQYCLSFVYPESARYRMVRIHEYSGGIWQSQLIAQNCELFPLSFVTSDNIDEVRISIINTTSNHMLNTGSTALPYEPYGVKIPISSGGVTTNIYLGSTQTVRRIKKYEFTGQEEWSISNNERVLYAALADHLTSNELICYCSHYKSIANISAMSVLSNGECSFNNTLRWFYIKDDNYNDANSFKSYLAQQYAAGTPVTVWYVLATETTGIVNEPLRKIGDYADTVSGITIPTIAGANTLSIGTTLQPSEVTVNYKGWHPVADVHERENGAWT